MSVTPGDSLFERRILLIDDNEAIHVDYRKSLGADASGGDDARELAAVASDLFGDGPARSTAAAPTFSTESASQGAEGLALLEKAAAADRPFAVAFVDMRMPPGWDGLETVERLWRAAPDLQCVICTAYSDYSWEDLVGRLGARDNLLLLRKPFDRAEVVQLATALSEKWRLARAARLRTEELERLVGERTEQLEAAARLDKARLEGLESAVDVRTKELRRAAMTDRLTGLPNRSLLNDRLSQAVEDARRDPTKKFAVLYLDFDRFKVINDSLGHETGDLLLVAVAERIGSVIRSTDCVGPDFGTAARLGGDEFAVLLADLSDCEVAHKIAQRLLDALLPPYLIRGHQIHCTASFGVTTSDFKYERAEDVVRDADTAMYRAKAAGRSRIMRFDPTMHDDALARLTLETALRSALANDELSVHLQPIVRISDRAVAGFEALARWKHPQRGWISPAEFIPVAEETGLIVPLGTEIMRKAFRVASDWRRRYGDRAPYVTVNLSPKQLMEQDLLKRIDAALAETGASPRDLHLEVTETYLMTDTEGAIATLRRIRERGLGLMIDDFGTGYSSLSSLHRFPFTGMKIDRSFLVNSESVRNYAAVLVAMTTLAHDLGLKVIAEGVENARQLALLETVHCDRAQGFYFSRPMPIDAAERYLVESFDAALAPTPGR